MLNLKLKQFIFQNFKIKGMSFPSSVQDIKRFLNINKHLNLKVNIIYKNTREEYFPYQYGLGEGKNLSIY